MENIKSKNVKVLAIKKKKAFASNFPSTPGLFCCL